MADLDMIWDMIMDLPPRPVVQDPHPKVPLIGG